MTTRRGDLEGEPGLLACPATSARSGDGRRRPGSTAPARGTRRPGRLPAQHGDQLGQAVAPRPRPRPGRPPPRRRSATGTTTVRRTRARSPRARPAARRAPDARAVEAELADAAPASATALGRHLLGRGERRGGQGQVEPAARLGSDAGDRFSVMRCGGHVLAAVDHRGADAVARLRQRGVRQPDEGERRAARGARSASTSTTWPTTPTSADRVVRASVTRAPPAGARPAPHRCRGASTPTTSKRTWAGRAPVVGEPARGEPSQPRGLGCA